MKALDLRLLGRGDECMGYIQPCENLPTDISSNLLSTSPALEDNGTWRAVPFLVSGSRATLPCQVYILPLQHQMERKSKWSGEIICNLVVRKGGLEPPHHLDAGT